MSIASPIPKFLLPSLACLALLLGACNLPQPQADPVRYFTLAGPATTTPVADPVRVAPVQVSGHLRNRALAVRVSEQEVIYLDEVVWAEPIADSITQVLRQRLEQIGGGTVVRVQIQRCEPNRAAGQAVQCVATYVLVRPAGSGATEQRGVFTASARAWDGRDPGALVEHLRAAIQELADHLAERIAQNANSL